MKDCMENQLHNYKINRVVVKNGHWFFSITFKSCLYFWYYFSLTSFAIIIWITFFRPVSSEIPVGWTSLVVIIIFWWYSAFSSWFDWRILRKSLFDFK